MMFVERHMDNHQQAGHQQAGRQQAERQAAADAFMESLDQLADCFAAKPVGVRPPAKANAALKISSEFQPPIDLELLADAVADLEQFIQE